MIFKWIKMWTAELSHKVVPKLISISKRIVFFLLWLFKLIICVARFLFTEWKKLKLVHALVRLLVFFFFVIFTSFFITEKLTPSDYTIRFVRECDGEKNECEKLKTIDSETGVPLEDEIGTLLTTLERFDFFARFTFLRFDLQTTNQSEFKLVVTEPYFEKSIPILMQCNIGGKNLIFHPNSGIIFTQKASINEIIDELKIVQDVLIACNPAPQNTGNMVGEPIEVAPNARVELRYNEEKYHLRFLPDKLNYPLTLLQVLVLTGIILGVYYDILKFIKKGFKG